MFIIIYVIGAFLGFIIETIFCWIATKKIMNRSTYIFWPLSSVWGGAFLLAGILFYWLKDAGIFLIFIMGFTVGSLYEYLYSAVVESVFGVKFWDYSGFRFHIKGRVNLPYSIGWGVVAVLWVKIIYPPIDFWIRTLSSSAILGIRAALMLELVIDTTISLIALRRYSVRHDLEPSSNRLWKWVDTYFSDAYMEDVFPYMIRKEK